MGYSNFSTRDASLFAAPESQIRRAIQSLLPQILYQGYALGLDGSHYIVADWATVLPHLDYLIWKGSEGVDYKDETFPAACQAAYDHALPFAAFHFFRIDSYLNLPFPSDQSVVDKTWPSPANDAQLQNMIAVLKNKAVHGLYIDIEATTELESGKPIATSWASKAAQVFVGRAWDYWRTTHPGQPFGIYTSNGYISTWAPDMVNWAGNYDNWVAQWAVYPTNTVTTTWENAKANYMPLDTSRPRPFGNGTAKLWQYTGDRLILPGITTNDAQHAPRTCDLDLYIGSVAAMRSYFNYTAPSQTPAPVPTPTPLPSPDPADLAALTARVEAIETKLNAAKIADARITYS